MTTNRQTLRAKYEKNRETMKNAQLTNVGNNRHTAELLNQRCGGAGELSLGYRPLGKQALIETGKDQDSRFHLKFGKEL